MKQIFAFIFFVFITNTFAQAKGILNSSTFAPQKGIEFIENAGQYKYSDGRKAGDILYVANTATGTVCVRKNGLNIINF